MRVKLLYTSIANTSITQNAGNGTVSICNGSIMMELCNGSIMIELCNGSVMMELCKGSIMMELCNGRVKTTWPEMLQNPLACTIRKHDWRVRSGPIHPCSKSLVTERGRGGCDHTSANLKGTYPSNCMTIV